MLPQVALALTLLFIGYLFKREFSQQYKPSFALWIPCLWLLLLGSRPVSMWLNLGQPIQGSAIQDGSPLERTIFFLLILAGLIALAKRSISWAQIFRSNIALMVFFLYCGISILWSDFPFVAFKRWSKGFGDPIMVLIILTESDPIKAVERVMKTCSYILLPLSILFIKYYPNLGRTYDEWTGGVMFTGVTTNKNTLGFILMTCGLFLVWKVAISMRRREGGKAGNLLDDLGIPLVLLGMIVWLFQMADSKTSLIGFMLGIVVFIFLGFENVRRHVGVYILVGIIISVVLEGLFDVKETIIASAGRQSTLSGRTELWDILLPMQQHPVLGFGFESFWLGERLRRLHEMYYFEPNQAHNGYIEMYLNLGWVGLLLFSGVILSCFMKLRKTLSSWSGENERLMFSRFGMAFLGIYIVYNYTEAAFRSLHFLFIVFLLFAITPPVGSSTRNLSLGRKADKAKLGT